MLPRSGIFRFDTRALASVLAWMRLLGVVGQGFAITVVSLYWRMPLPHVPLFGAVAVSACVGVAVLLRLRKPWPVSETEAAVYAAFDILSLGWLLFFAGGASNPFITLLLVPIALTAAALSWRFVAMIATLACAIYLALMRWYVPLPGMHLMHDTGFALHLAGMAVNFALAALLLAAFVGLLSEALRRQDSAIRKARERALRDQGILAIATQAAGVAHEMNTPLSSMRVLVAELLRERPSDADLRDDLALLAGEIERCRVVLRDMVATGREQLQARPHSATLQDFVEDCARRFRLLRPEVTLELALDPSHAPVRMSFELDMVHAVLNLLHNAADATLQAGSDRIVFAGRIEHEALALTVNDSGEGLPPRTWEVALQGSSKSDGLGLGLLLARATAERLHGELRAFATTAGSAIEFSVPLAALKGAR